MLQVLFRIPIKTQWTPDGVPIYGFGLMLFLAFLICTWMAGRRAEREGIAKEHIQDLAIWLFVGGLFGARVTFLLHKPPAGGFWDFLIEIPKIWDGGIVLYGSLVGGALAYALAYVLVYRRYNLSTARLADVIAPSIAVGLCLGRLGCFLNGCCFGQVACADCAVVAVHFPLSAPARESLVANGSQSAAGFLLDRFPDQPSGVKVGFVEPKSAAFGAGLRAGDVITEANGHKLAGLNAADVPIVPTRALADVFGRDWPRGQSKLTLTVLPEGRGEPKTLTFEPETLGLYPTQLYEVVSMFLLLLVLLAYFPLRHTPGQVMAVLMMGYAAHRFLNEVLRDDPRPVGFERYSSVVLFLVGLGLWVWLQLKPVAPAQEAATGSPTAAAGTAPAASATPG